jgi:hypothetical protein
MWDKAVGIAYDIVEEVLENLALAILFTVGVLLVILAACAPLPEGTKLSQEGWTPIGNGSSVKVIFLEDGTRCAIVDGSFSGGISCDWR